jgi:hypothetical protein
MIREANCDTIKSPRSMLSDTRTVITTNGRRSFSRKFRKVP